MSAALGHFAVFYGASRPTYRRRQTEFCTASGGAQADESVCVDNRILFPEFAVDKIGGSPSNGSFSMAITNCCRVPISETRPISKACQRVTSVIDSNISGCSSERDQRILTASRSAKRALLHCEREGGLNCESVYADSDIVGVGQCRTG